MLVLPNDIYLVILQYLTEFERMKIIRTSKQIRFLVSRLNGVHIKLVNKEPILSMNTINSLIVTRSHINVGNDYIYSYKYDVNPITDDLQITGIRTMRSIYLEAGNQVQINNNDRLFNIYVNKINLCDICSSIKIHPISITVSRLHIIIIFANSTIYLGLRSKSDYNNYFGHSKSFVNQRFFKQSLFPYNFGTSLNIRQAIVSACDTNENIYILSSDGTIDKLDFQKQSIKKRRLGIENPSWLSIDLQDRMFICNRNTVYCCSTSGKRLFKIDNIFSDLRCVAFDLENNLFVVDDHYILKVYYKNKIEI